jgi:PIN domain nuclease of toxin-antitoxin system
MTRLLLDTNAFAIARIEPGRLPTTARSAMAAADRLMVSAIAFYEIGFKVWLGKWPQMEGSVSQLERRAEEDGFDLLPLTPVVALASAALDWPHRDPFDRMMAATAFAENVPVVSADRAFDALPLTRIWD